MSWVSFRATTDHKVLGAPWVNATSRQRVTARPAAERVDDLRTLVELAAAGRFTPLIDSCVAFDAIAAAHVGVESGRKRGSVVVRVEDIRLTHAARTA